MICVKVLLSILVPQRGWNLRQYLLNTSWMYEYYHSITDVRVRLMNAELLPLLIFVVTATSRSWLRMQISQKKLWSCCSSAAGRTLTSHAQCLASCCGRLPMRTAMSWGTTWTYSWACCSLRIHGRHIVFTMHWKVCTQYASSPDNIVYTLILCCRNTMLSVYLILKLHNGYVSKLCM